MMKFKTVGGYVLGGAWGMFCGVVMTPPDSYVWAFLGGMILMFAWLSLTEDHGKV